jgi:hypothetical protein
MSAKAKTNGSGSFKHKHPTPAASPTFVTSASWPSDLNENIRTKYAKEMEYGCPELFQPGKWVVETRRTATAEHSVIIFDTDPE